MRTCVCVCACVSTLSIHAFQHCDPLVTSNTRPKFPEPLMEARSMPLSLAALRAIGVAATTPWGCVGVCVCERFFAFVYPR